MNGTGEAGSGAAGRVSSNVTEEIAWVAGTVSMEGGIFCSGEEGEGTSTVLSPAGETEVISYLRV